MGLHGLLKDRLTFYIIIIIIGTELNPMALVRERTVLTERPRLSAKLMPTFADRRCRVVSSTDPHGRILGFLDRSRYYFFQIAPQLYSRD
jgi:hypothetical protein